jgi:hypothetical protein
MILSAFSSMLGREIFDSHSWNGPTGGRGVFTLIKSKETSQIANVGNFHVSSSYSCMAYIAKSIISRHKKFQVVISSSVDQGLVSAIFVAGDKAHNAPLRRSPLSTSE